MSKKLKEIENKILKLYSSKEYKQQNKEHISLMGYTYNMDLDTPESLETSINSLMNERQFELENINRKWYKQSWFHILITSISTIITTVAATWFISRFIS